MGWPALLLVIAGTSALMSIAAFIAFAWDKRCAALGRRRIPERTLHTLELLGGWPGALLAILWLRHKNRKPAFLVWTGLISALHLACWAAAIVWRARSAG
jgi:uncharacterized membrane protein YsdA (DUF1294 family)